MKSMDAKPVPDALLCGRCKGKNLCGRPCPILARIRQFKKIIENVDLNFVGTSPPACFVGRAFYPNVNFSILTPPDSQKEAWQLDAPRWWFEQKESVGNILGYRATLIAARTSVNVKRPAGRILEVGQELAQTKRPADAEIWLKKKPRLRLSLDSRLAPIGSPAQIERARLVGNPHISRPVDKVSSQDDIKAVDAINYLYQKGIDENAIMKILAVGLLGLKDQRRLVPSRWSVTAVDDTISKNLLAQVKTYDTISEYRLFSATYLGNHFEILLLPSCWSFEVIEAKLPGSVWNLNYSMPTLWADYENFFGRKGYADSVTGAYYSDRLAVAEHLTKIKRQAAALILREVSEEYWAPLGVWVNRETCREALQKNPQIFSSLNEALVATQTRLKLPLDVFKKKSLLLKQFVQQKTLAAFR